MKKQETNLLEKRAELKQVINEGMEKTFPAYLFNAVGRGLVKIFSLNAMPGWIFSAVVLGVLILAPGGVVVIASGEILQWNNTKTVYLALIPFGYLASVVSHLNIVFNLLPGIRDDIVDSILNVEDLIRMEKWLKDVWAFRKWLIFSLTFGFFVSIVFIVILSFANGSFIGIGLAVLTFSVSPFYVGPLYIIFRTITLPAILSKCELRLYESDPANSEVIQRLVYILNVYTYYIAGYVAAGTAIAALNPGTTKLVWIFIFIGWTPTIMQFLINQHAVRKIISTAKWRSLNHLQGQIKELQNNNLKDAPETTIARINQLMDLHDRISAKPNSALNWGTGLSFLNQLMLPLLGLLLGNMDKLLKLLARTP